MSEFYTPLFFDPYNWYWINSDETQVFASKRAKIVAADDAEYKTWKEVGRRPTPWPRDNQGRETNAALQDVLTPYNIQMPSTGKSK